MNELKKTRDEALRGQKKSRGDEAAAERELLNINEQIKASKKSIEELEKTLNEGTQQLSDKLKGEKEIINKAIAEGKLQPISLEATKGLMDNIMKSGDLEAARAVAENGLREYIEANPNTIIAEQAEELGLIFKGLADGLSRAEQAFNAEEAKRAVEEFNNNLSFSSYSSGTFDNMRELSKDLGKPNR